VSDEAKDAVSHRGKALEKFKTELKKYIEVE
jgi:inosine/xanthosine triphosphate pyrophosphatase family protein